MNPWPIWWDAQTWNRLYEALDAFGIVDARFLPYWSQRAAGQDNGARTDPQVLISCYVGKSGAVLAVMNTGEAIQAKVLLDLKRVGLKAISAATDVLRDEKIMIEYNVHTVPLERRQGRVLLLRP